MGALQFSAGDRVRLSYVLGRFTGRTGTITKHTYSFGGNSYYNVRLDPEERQGFPSVTVTAKNTWLEKIIE